MANDKAVSEPICLKEALAVYYTVIKRDGHLRTRRKCTKHEP